MSTAAHDDGRWDELAAGYALHALEPDDEQTFRDHLDGCAACRASLDEHALVAAQLASIADDAEAPAPPWSRIRPALGVPTAEPVASAPAAVTAAQPEAVVRQLRPRHTRLLAAAAAVVAVAAIGVAGWQVGHHSSGGAAVPSAIAGCRAASGCTVIPLLAGKAEAGDVLVRDGSARVVPTAMPALDAGHVYVLWQLPRDGAPTPVTVVGSAVRTAQASPSTSLAIPYADTAAFAMSVEPADRVPTKPTKVVAVGTAT